MKPQVAHEIPKLDLILFEIIRKGIERIPDDITFGVSEETNQEIVLTCHMLAEAIKQEYKLERVDGRFAPARMSHSWNYTKNGNIIDSYPCGIIGGPILIYLPNPFYIKLDWKQAYQEIKLGPEKIYWNCTEKEFKKSVKEICLIIKSP